VEFLTAFFFLILFWKSNEHFSVIFFQDVLLFSLGMNIFFIDLQHKIIPDALTLLVAISGILFSFFSETPLNWEQSLLGFFTGFVSFVLVAYLCKWMLKKDCLGGGDIKLIAGLGAFVGVIGVFITIFIASVVALVTLLVIKHDLKKEFPFGPFLIVGVLIYHFFGAHLITLYLAIWSL
jgi:leader peptidase (prepilin peptidase)/N-methyltransferase